MWKKSVKMIKTHLGVRDYISLAKHCWIESQVQSGDRLGALNIQLGSLNFLYKHEATIH